MEQIGLIGNWLREFIQSYRYFWQSTVEKGGHLDLLKLFWLGIGTINNICTYIDKKPGFADYSKDIDEWGAKESTNFREEYKERGSIRSVY